MGLSEAIEVVTQMLRGDADKSSTRYAILTRREVQALQRLITDATITLNQISAGVLRREGRSR